MSQYFVYGQDDEMAAWAANQIGLGGGYPAGARAIGFRKGGRIEAVTVWYDFELWNCAISFAHDGSIACRRREYLFRSFAYPFLQLNLPRVTCYIPEGNRAAVGLVRHLGFVPEGALRKAVAGQDEIVFGMLRGECRWIGPAMARHAA